MEVNKLPVIDDLDILEQQCVTVLQPNNWGFSPEDIFRSERKLLEETLLSTDAMRFLALFPGKVFLNFFTKSLGIETFAYKELINNALVAVDGSDLSTLKQSLVSALVGVLPSR